MDQLLIHIFIDRVVYQDDLSFCLGKINIIAVFRVQERGLDPIRRSAAAAAVSSHCICFFKGFRYSEFSFKDPPRIDLKFFQAAVHAKALKLPLDLQGGLFFTIGSGLPDIIKLFHKFQLAFSADLIIFHTLAPFICIFDTRVRRSKILLPHICFLPLYPIWEKRQAWGTADPGRVRMACG